MAEGVRSQTLHIIYMENLTIQDVMDIQKIQNKDCHWSQKTGIWAIVAVLLILAAMWFVNRQGRDKADLAASIQGLYGRVNALEPAVTAQGNNIMSINSVLSATAQAVGDFKTTAIEQLAALNGAVFVPRCGANGNNCGGGTKFVKRDNYCLNDSSLQAIESCG